MTNNFFIRVVSCPLLKHSIILALFAILILPTIAKAQTPVFPGPPLVGTLAQRPSACGTLLQEYYATDNTTLYYATVSGVSCTWVAVPVGATSVLLQTNGVNNGSQVKLNLAAGSNTTISDGGTGTITVTATGGGSGTSPGGAANSVQYNNTTFGGSTVNSTATKEYLQQFSSGVPAFAQIAAGDISGLAASATTDTTVATNISSGTLPAARLPVPSASTLGGVQSITLTTHNFLTTISTSGVPSKAQPACGDLSDAAPSCNTDTTNATNITSGRLPAAQLPSPTASTLGGIESFVAVSHNWINTISTAGVPSATRPSAADLSDTATAGNFLRGNGTSFISAVIQAADVPTLNQDSTGTAAALSAASALPDMTTATTQAPADNSTNVATTAYADAEAGAQNPLTTIGDVWGGGASGVPARIAGGLTGQSLVSTNSAASTFSSPGVGGRSVSGTTDTILGDSGTTLRDRGTTIKYTSASSVATTLPQAGSSGMSSNFVYSPFQTGAGTQTITPTTSTINGQTTLQIIQNAWCSVSSPDNTNYIARCANYVKAGAGLTPTFNADGSTTLAMSRPNIYVDSNFGLNQVSGTTITGGFHEPLKSGTLVLVWVDNDHGASNVASITDSLSDTYTQIGTEGGFCGSPGPGDWSDVYYTTIGSNGNPTITATFTSAATNKFIAEAAYSGVTSVDSATFARKSGVLPFLGSTTSTANSTVVAIDGSCGSTGVTGPSGWNLRESWQLGTALPLAIEDLSIPISGSLEADWSDYYTGDHGLWNIAIH